MLLNEVWCSVGQNVLIALILDYFVLYISESVIDGTFKYKLLNRTQLAFVLEFEQYGSSRNQIFVQWVIRPNKFGRWLEDTQRVNLFDAKEYE